MAGVILSVNGFSQTIYQDRLYQFLSFEAVPTWTGVASDWDKGTAQIHLYDPIQYKGHAQYISVALKTGITFAQFKEQVREYSSRKYMPFFLFDLRKHPVTVEGKTCTWAVRVEDYGYRDNPEQMATTTLRLLRTLTDYIRMATGKSTHGIIILATNPESQPNTGIAPILNQAGFPNKTVTQLIALVGGKQVNVLNPGTGVGYLRYVKAGEEVQFKADVKDIVVYERMPARVPPVNGIITLEPQTPLSHVNLLAKNRGTFNLYTLDTSALPGLLAHINKLTRVECTAQRITFHAATPKEAETFWVKHQSRVDIPQADTALKTVQRFGSLDSHVASHQELTAQQVGAKAANYALIQQLYPHYVRPGCAIPFVLYFRAIHSCGAQVLIQDLITLKQSLSVAEIEQRLAAIRARILTAKLDPEFLQSVTMLAQSQYPGQRIRLRSSTNCEDLPGFNGAGLYLSKGLDAHEIPQKLENRILQIYASLWTPLAWAEREFYFIDHGKVGMSILIHEAYGDEYANGVVLTVPDQKDFAIVINTQYGDSAVANPGSGHIPEAITFKTSLATSYVIESRSNLHDVFLQDSLAAQLAELKDIAAKVHKVFQARAPKTANIQYGVDIEFKLVREGKGYRLYIKQARLLGQVLPE